MEAFIDLLHALASCPEMKGEVILRVLRLIEKAKHVTTRSLTDLLDLMHAAGMLEPQVFSEVPLFCCCCCCPFSATT